MSHRQGAAVASWLDSVLPFGYRDGLIGGAAVCYRPLLANMPTPNFGWHRVGTKLAALSPETLEKISERNKHLEDGYVPTSSLFPGTGI